MCLYVFRASFRLSPHFCACAGRIDLHVMRNSESNTAPAYTKGHEPLRHTDAMSLAHRPQYGIFHV
jgi:hypothetical protein